jgi:small conductance mechanosensitive channel
MNYVIEYGPKVILFIVLLVAGWIVAGWAGRLVRKQLTAREFDPTLTKVFASLTRWLVILLVVIALLGYLGVATASFAAVLGAAGLAIGLAFQGTLSNFAAGVMLLVFRPFKVGDVISAGGETGKVDEVGLFVTALDTLDNKRIVVPNSAVAGGAIKNATFHPIRRVDVNVGTDYDADLLTVRKVLQGVVKRIHGDLDEPAPQVFLAELGDSSINWQVRIWCNTEDYWDVFDQTTQETKRALDEAGIGIPFPQRDVHLYQE